MQNFAWSAIFTISTFWMWGELFKYPGNNGKGGGGRPESDIKNSYLNICYHNYYIDSKTENNTRTKICLQC